MNSILECLGSGGWAHLVMSLLHTLWQGTLLALALHLVLRRIANPLLRYRLCLGTLCAVVLAGVLTWAILEVKPRTTDSARVTSTQISTGEITGNAAVTHQQNRPHPTLPPVEPSVPKPSAHWTAWGALIWIAGMTFMLGRATAAVAGAHRISSETRPLEDESILQMIRDAQARFGLRRHIRTVVTESLSSPAVSGIVVVTLVLPLSLLTTMPMNQLQWIVFHELAHIRRGDYLANLFQMLIESLLFFNPAVWWISRQVRQEREACCDALAVAMANTEPLEYARALAEVAGRSWTGGAVPAPAFSEPRNRSGLKDRVHRLLTPGYRPGLRLTWQALIGTLLSGGLILVFSAIGAERTVEAAAKLLTPQERIDRIATNIESLGQHPEALAHEGPAEGKVRVQARIRSSDGSRIPRNSCVSFTSLYHGGSYSSGFVVGVDQNGFCAANLPRGDVYLEACIDGFAPAVVGPLDIRMSNDVATLEMTLDRGFSVTVRVTDAETGAALPDAGLGCTFFDHRISGNIGNPRRLISDAHGEAMLDDCAQFPLHIQVALDGYESVEKDFEKLGTNQVLQVTTRKALPISGIVTEKSTGEPVVGAKFQVISQEDAPGINTADPWYPGQGSIAQTDENGKFRILGLPRSGRYWFYVKAPGLSGSIVEDVRCGTTNLAIALGPEMVVRGKLVGGDVEKIRNGVCTHLEWTVDRNMRYFGNYLRVRVEDGVGYFVYTNPVIGPAKLTIDEGWEFTTNATASVENWVIQNPVQKSRGTRAVVLKFEHKSGVPPSGTVEVSTHTVPGYSTSKLHEIVNGEVQFQAPVGSGFSLTPACTVGYWFTNTEVPSIESGTTPLIIKVPLIPAGAIYATIAADAKSSPGKYFYSIIEVKPSPRTENGCHPMFTYSSKSSQFKSDEESRTFVASSLPLDGIYQITVCEGNRFSASEPITLTEQSPDRKIQFRFGKSEKLSGRLLSKDGKPVAHGKLEVYCYVGSSGIGRGVCAESDDAGNFEIPDCSPAFTNYQAVVRAPGFRATQVALKFGQEGTEIRLEPGLSLKGKVIDKDGHPVPLVDVMMFAQNHGVPGESIKTDTEGNFAISTLDDDRYTVSVFSGTASGSKSDLIPGTDEPVIIQLNGSYIVH